MADTLPDHSTSHGPWTVYVCSICGYMASNRSWHGCADGPSLSGDMWPVEVVPKAENERLRKALREGVARDHFGAVVVSGGWMRAYWKASDWADLAGVFDEVPR